MKGGHGRDARDDEAHVRVALVQLRVVCQKLDRRSIPAVRKPRKPLGVHVHGPQGRVEQGPRGTQDVAEANRCDEARATARSFEVKRDRQGHQDKVAEQPIDVVPEVVGGPRHVLDEPLGG